jgi:hypothetical protein
MALGHSAQSLPELNATFSDSDMDDIDFKEEDFDFKTALSAPVDDGFNFKTASASLAESQEGPKTPYSEEEEEEQETLEDVLGFDLIL